MTEGDAPLIDRSESLTVSSVAALAATIADKAGHHRLVVAIAGPPGVGKTTTSEKLQNTLVSLHRLSTQVVPMDGFHYDNAILEQSGLLPRKGAPETFDIAGLEHTLMRLTATQPQDVAIPVFDRSMELSRSSARIIQQDTSVLLVEGNYLLLDSDPWRGLPQYYGFSVMIECEEATLKNRLTQRWLDMGFDEQDALRKVETNDLPNARTVMNESLSADCYLNESESTR